MYSRARAKPRAADLLDAIVFAWRAALSVVFRAAHGAAYRKSG